MPRAKAFACFPDQEAIFYVELGEATIATRAAPAVPVVDIRPFELHRANGVLERSRAKIATIGAASWAVEIALRDIRVLEGRGEAPANMAPLYANAAKAVAALDALI